MRHYSRNKLAPASRSGNLYYIRLRTDLGPLYKVGFTTRSSAEERLAFRETGDDRLIDKTILFIHFEDAYSVEQQIHGYFYDKRVFGKFGNYTYMPLAGNGQSELYAHDILGLDGDYADAQAERTIKAIKTRHAMQKHSHPMMVYLSAHGIEQLAKILAIPFMPVRWIEDFLDRRDERRRKSLEEYEVKRKALLEFLRKQQKLQSAQHHGHHFTILSR